MRPGQNKRMRGRNNTNNGGNRKGPNPLTRSYESNGPDVKIRGNAHHIAEKYLQLARDAQSSGDPVTAESYLQHAEHYFRLIASFQQGQMGFNRPADEADLDDDDDGVPDRFASPQAPAPYAAQTQPYAGERPAYNGDRQPYNGDRPSNAGGERQPYADRSYNDRQTQERPVQDRNGQDRSSQDRNGQDRNGQDRNGQDRNGYDRSQRTDRNGSGRRPYRDNDRGAETRGTDMRTTETRTTETRNSDDRQNRNGERRNGERPHQDRPYRDPQSGEARDLFTGEQPRVETSDRQIEAASTAAPRTESFRAPEPPRIAEAPARPTPLPAVEPGLDVSPSVEDAPGLPSFITTPTRIATPVEPLPEGTALPMTSAFPGDESDPAPKFPRRRRRQARTGAEAVDAGRDEPATND